MRTTPPTTSPLPLFLPFLFMTLQSAVRPTGRDECASAKQPGPLRGWISVQGATGAYFAEKETQKRFPEFMAAGGDSVESRSQHTVSGFLHLKLQSPWSTGTPCFGFPWHCRESRKAEFCHIIVSLKHK